MGICVSIPNQIKVNHNVSVVGSVKIAHNVRIEIVWPNNGVVGVVLGMLYLFMLMAFLIRNFVMGFTILGMYAAAASLYLVIHFIQGLALHSVEYVIVNLHKSGIDVFGTGAQHAAILAAAIPPNPNWPVNSSEWGPYIRSGMVVDALIALRAAGFRFERNTQYAHGAQTGSFPLELWVR
jgi:hypothetical protein